MATIRKWLDEAGFDWAGGTVIVQHTTPDERPGWEGPVAAHRAGHDDPMVTREFYDGHGGGPECPRFFARDGHGVYFPGQYDGATFLIVVVIDPDHYLDVDNFTPYLGS